MNTAKELKKLDDFTGDARLFQLSQPVEYGYDYKAKKYEKSTEFVVISAASAMFSGPETYIFPANEEGEVVDWCELEGSFKGGLDHERALKNAGYEITE